jgi:hypothetical protein
MRPGDAPQRRAPVFVGVSAADPQTADHARGLGGALRMLGWPARVEERNVGHAVDEAFLVHGLKYLRAHLPPREPTAPDSMTN